MVIKGFPDEVCLANTSPSIYCTKLRLFLVQKAKILAVYRHISTFLAKTSKKFQITNVARGARNREYIGAVEWLEKAGVVNICYCLSNPELPLKVNYDTDTYKVYYHDTGLLIASLDEEAQEDLRANKNFGTYKGAIYENIVGEMLRKSGYEQLWKWTSSSAIPTRWFLSR
ncbi:MAG: DUF4143 domain-containing protein [Bacteroidales bacterium]|nr:DUF4143 domain-containing protein [Bacteroidales bacterium]